MYLAEAPTRNTAAVAIRWCAALCSPPGQAGCAWSGRSATLQTPNIARVLDGGRRRRRPSSHGVPRRRTIDAYCYRCSCRPKNGSRWCAQWAQPSTRAPEPDGIATDRHILITVCAARRAKLLDFGIAKLLDTRQSASTLAVTHAEYRVMTPAHASPEQVRGDVITTASDIYVLGVLLYELLCGRRPFQLLGASLLEMERIICEQEAPTPSEMVARIARESPELLTDIVAPMTTPARLQKFPARRDRQIRMAMPRTPTPLRSAEQCCGLDSLSAKAP